MLLFVFMRRSLLIFHYSNAQALRSCQVLWMLVFKAVTWSHQILITEAIIKPTATPTTATTGRTRSSSSWPSSSSSGCWACDACDWSDSNVCFQKISCLCLIYTHTHTHLSVERDSINDQTLQELMKQLAKHSIFHLKINTNAMRNYCA